MDIQWNVPGSRSSFQDELEPCQVKNWPLEIWVLNGLNNFPSLPQNIKKNNMNEFQSLKTGKENMYIS